MTAPQLRYYVAPRAGQSAIVDHVDGSIVAWVVREPDRLRARRGAWISAEVRTIAELVDVVSERFAVPTPSVHVER